MSGSRVDPYLRYVDEPYGDHAELGAARSELAAAVLPLLPAGSTVHTPTIERTDAGRAQANAVTPRETNVAIDVELNIRLPTSSRFPSGVRFKPDGIRFLPNRRYLFLEHKEVMTIWSKSHYSRDFAKREIEILLQRNADIYLDLCPYGCAGFQFSSNSDSLSDIIADAVSDIGGPGRQGLLAPILKSTYRKSSE